MKPKKAASVRQTTATSPQVRDIGGLLADLRELIQTARQHALRAVDVVQVRTCWSVGQHIVEFEQGGAVRAAYGKRLLTMLAENLTAEFGKGFDASNLRYMRLFYQAFPNCDALRHELSWTHYRSLLSVEDAAARLWYMNEAADQNWNTRALDRQIGTLYYSQMDMYVRMYDDLRRGPGDNPTVGIILCARKDKSVVHYSVLNGNQQLFAAKYKLVLPSEEELRTELARGQGVWEEHATYLASRKEPRP